MDAPGNQTSSESVAGAVTPERAAYYARIGKENLAPLWEVLKGLVPPERASSSPPRKPNVACWYSKILRCAASRA